MREQEMKRYRCANGHVIGLIRWDGHNAARLLYLRHSLDENAQVPHEPEVAAIIDSGDVTCSICGDSMVWVPTMGALLRLLKSHKKLMDGLRALQVEDEPMNPAFLERG